MAYITEVSKKYSNTHGVVQIIPPAGWQPSMTVDLRTRRHLAFEVRQQVVQKPDMTVVQKPHPKITWTALMKQADALHAKWTKERPQHTKPDLASNDTLMVDDVSFPRPSPAAESPSATAGVSTAAAASPSYVSSSEDCVRECLYNSMRRIVLTYGYLDAAKRKEVEAEQRKVKTSANGLEEEEQKLEATVMEDVGTAEVPQSANAASPDCAPSDPLLPFSSTLDAELSYWSWVYSNAKSKTLYATDVESIPEFRQHRVESVSATAPSPCDFCLSSECRMVRAPSSWDLHSIARLPGGLLKYLGGTAPGVTDAMIYAGQVLSSVNFRG